MSNNKSTLAEKIAIIRRISHLVVSDAVRVNGSCGLMIALLMERALPSPVLFALMAYIIAPGDLDLVFTSNNEDTFYELIGLLIDKPVWKAEHELKYACKDSDDEWVKGIKCRKDLPEESTLKLDACKALSPYKDEFAVKATIIVSEKFIIMKGIQSGNVSVDIRFAAGEAPKTSAKMYQMIDFDSTTVGKGLKPDNMKAAWLLKASFSRYYTRMNAVGDRSFMEALEAFERLAATVDKEYVYIALIEFINAERFTFSFIKPNLVQALSANAVEILRIAESVPAPKK